MDARDFVKLLKPKLAKCGATRVPRTPAEPGYRTARRVSPLPSSCSAERVALLGSHLLDLPTPNHKLPPQCPTGTVTIRCAPDSGHPLEMHSTSIPSRYTTSRRNPIIICLASQPTPFASSTHHAQRLPHSSPTPIFRKECRLDRLTGIGPPQYVAASIPYRVPPSLPRRITVVKFLSARSSRSLESELVSELNPK